MQISVPHPNPSKSDSPEKALGGDKYLGESSNENLEKCYAS